MGIEKMREDFLQWLMEVHGLESEWQPERNCFKDFPAHLAFQAWIASREAIDITLPVCTYLGNGNSGKAATESWNGALKAVECILENVWIKAK